MAAGVLTGTCDGEDWNLDIVSSYVMHDVIEVTADGKNEEERNQEEFVTKDKANTQDLNNEKKSLKRSLNEAKSHVKNNTNEMIESNKKLKSEVKTLEKSLSNLLGSSHQEQT